MNDLTAKQIAPHCKTCHQEYDLYYRVPRIVPRCGHTFCEKCIILKLTVKSNRKVFICPECKEEAVIRKSVADDVPKNQEIISIVKQLKRLTYNQWEQDKKQQTECLEHGRPLELVCQTCKYEPICSHCALFGQHRNHSFVKERPVSKVDLNQLKTNFEIVSSSVEQYLLPQGENNIKERMRKKICEGLRREVTNAFKQYYTMLQKKQFQLVQECDNIVINEGGIDKDIDSVLSSFDSLKLKYQNQYQLYTDSTSFKQQFNKNLSLQNVQQFMNKCNEVHSILENIEKHANEHITKITKDIGIYISQATMFKIQEMPFSIKRVVEQMDRPNGVSEIMGSPNKQKSKMKSTNSDIKYKGVVIAQPQNDKSSIFRENKSQQKQSIVTVTKKRGSYSTIDKAEVVDDVSDNGANSGLVNYKEQTHNDLKSLVDKKIQHKSIERNTLPPKNRQSYVPPQSHTISMRPPKDETSKIKQKRSIDKAVQPPRTTSVISKASKSVILTGENTSLTEELKFVAPTKEISFQFLSKFQEIMGEVDRQGESNTLELNSKQINDVLLVYVLDYLRRKKYAFQIIKLVKNAITNEGMRILLGYLQNDTTAEVLNLTSNQLTSRCLDLVVLFASKNNILRTLYLSNNNKISSFQLKSRQGELDKYQFNLII